jgi:hypothetical protein
MKNQSNMKTSNLYNPAVIEAKAMKRKKAQRIQKHNYKNDQ